MITPGQIFNPVVGVPFTAPVLTSVPHSGFLAETPEYIGIDPSTGVLSGTLSKIYSGNAKVSYQSAWADLFSFLPKASHSAFTPFDFRNLGVTTDGVIIGFGPIERTGGGAVAGYAQTMVSAGSNYVQVCSLSWPAHPQGGNNILALKNDGIVELFEIVGTPAFPNVPTFTVSKIGVTVDQRFWALRTTGKVYAWDRTAGADADLGTVGGVAVNLNVTKFATNRTSTRAINNVEPDRWVLEKTDGSVYSNISGTPALIAGITGTVADIAAGRDRVYIRNTAGVVFVTSGTTAAAAFTQSSPAVSIHANGYWAGIVYADGKFAFSDGDPNSHPTGGYFYGGSGCSKIYLHGNGAGGFVIKSDGSAQTIEGGYLNFVPNVALGTSYIARPYASISFGGVGGAPNINIGDFVIPARQEFESQCTVYDQRATPASNWSATGLPAGLTISATGLISGTPTEVGTFNPTISALGGDGSRSSVVFTIRIVGGLAVINANQTITGRVDVPLSVSLALDSISAPPLYFKAVGLPFYMKIADDGALIGTPNKVGSFSLAVTVFSVFGSSTETVNFVIAPGIPAIDPNQKIDAWLDFPLSYFPRLQNPQNSPASAWSATGLPTGATINSSTGEITWTPSSVIAPVSVAITVSGGGSSTTTSLPLRVLKSAYIYRGNKNLQLISHQRQTSDSGLSVVSAEYICPTPNAASASRLLQARMALPNFPDHTSKDSAAQNYDTSGFAKFSITGFAGRKSISVPVDVPTVFGTQLSSVSMTLNRGPNAAPWIFNLRILSDTITKKFTIGESTSMTEIGLPSEPIKFDVFEITNTTTSESYGSFAEFLQIFAPTFEITAGGTNRRFTTIVPAPETALASLSQLLSVSRTSYGEIDEVTATWGLAFTNFEIKAIPRTEFIPF